MSQAEFSYKLKPKLPQQFKAAEQGAIPFGIILGEEELAAGKCRIKEMGLPEGHPEKEGVEVEIASLVPELQTRLAKKQQGVISSLAQQLQGTSV
jgi:histidyl-tRNA synthetase